MISRIKTKVNRLLGRELQTLSLDLVSLCNIACETCSLKKHFPKSPRPRISWETLENLRYAFERVKMTDLQMNCEPLLHKEVVEIVKFIKGITKGTVGFVTNATLLTEEKSEELIDAGLDHIGVSFDGASKEMFEGIRTGAVFETVLENVRTLKRVKQRRGVTYPALAIGAVALKRNMSEMISIVELAAELGAVHVWVNGVEPYTKEMLEEVVYTPVGVPNPRAEEIEAIRTRAKELGMAATLFKPEMQAYSNCDLRGAVVSAAGEVYPCGSLSYARPFYYLGELKMHPSHSFGSVAEKPFEEIWNSPKYSTFREDLRAGELPEMCQACLFRNRVTCAID